MENMEQIIAIGKKHFPEATDEEIIAAYQEIVQRGGKEIPPEALDEFIGKMVEGMSQDQSGNADKLDALRSMGGM